MIESIVVCNDASYNAPQTMTALKQLNFVYGANGSGKTTISRIISETSLYPRASLQWKDARPVETLVYNVDFVRKTFVTQMRGIFTLGEESADILEKIEAAKAQAFEYWNAIGNLQNNLGQDENSGKRGELKTLQANFEEQCWGVKQRHDAHFKVAFEGLRGNKARFCDRVLAEASSNNAALHDVDTLKTRAETIFQDGLERIEPLVRPSFADLSAYEAHATLSKKIVGKEDVDIAGLIQRLGNSDWVKAGMDYLDDSGERCPFCQQRIDADLTARLNEYFDETYIADMAAINSLAENYATATDTVLTRLETILAHGSKHLDQATMQAEFDRFKSRIDANRNLIEAKRKEPSSVVLLESTAEINEEILRLITEANAAIAVHNDMVTNHASEKAKLTNEIWQLILEEEKVSLKAFLDAKTVLDRAIAGLTDGIEKKTEDYQRAKLTLTELEKSVTSVQPTVNDINAMLESFGFTGFKLATAPDQDHLYVVVREDGADATATLSEGEKSFITFLYFFSLIRGSHAASGLTANRIVVFDDPVSSLDSDVLFIVSALIKRILDEAKKGKGLVKQVFVLTHNIYFHKEVTFDSKRKKKCQNHETFWIVRKTENISSIEPYDHNPIRTSYELLWNEVRKPERSNITIQNTLRRILENYFTILGNRDKDDIIDRFDGREKLVCASLYAWVNDGSHSAYDDCYVSPNEGQVGLYLAVFKRIFEETQHIAHYNMMMGIEDTDEAIVADIGPVAVAAT
ncbi:AAA family ATPase [Novosphingobium sp.]|uniref:AAA family ATPase n=1 Tax=Novosphingobium sp. TaxID=1874826 RepID=UPI002612435E|nr:AAA family ATPase [Novosphingobium sp.]